MKQHTNRIERNSPVLSAETVVDFSGIEAAVLLEARDGTPLSVIKMRVSQGKGAPSHVSPEEDKVFQVTDGKFLFLVGASRVEAAAGDCIFVHKGEIHSFRALTSNEATMTLVSTPAGHERFFIELSQLTLPHEESKVAEICRRCAQEIVGPVVEALPLK
ncbi:cupin domain-containing protein [Pseudohaliea sp.]|uniref:cupin domain-containing protein n=1 Tax=Pseudohaliea sp. TaxID=2740289 RepID=UPI0032F00090